MPGSMPGASPAKWHLGHTSWFFETFVLMREGVLMREDVLARDGTGYCPPHPEYQEVFGVSAAGGDRRLRRVRGLLSRPTVAEVFDYRRQVDDGVAELLEGELPDEIREIVLLGLHHEQQHQERLLIDLKHLFSLNPLTPAYRQAADETRGGEASPLRFVSFAGGTLPFGHQGAGFAYDNERPRHQRLVEPFQLASRLITNGEYLEFVAEGGYREASLWLSDGWDARVAGDWEAPLYWVRQGDDFAEFSLGGLLPLALDAPVIHLSYFEADAFARWREARLPTEFEWESAAAHRPVAGTLLENGGLRPSPAPRGTRLGGSGPGGSGPAPVVGRAPSSSSGTPGSGRRAPTSPTRGSGRRGSSANRPASPCPAGWCSAADPASPRLPTSAPPTATSSGQTPAGTRRGSGSPATGRGAGRMYTPSHVTRHSCDNAGPLVSNRAPRFVAPALIPIGTGVDDYLCNWSVRPARSISPL